MRTGEGVADVTLVEFLLARIAEDEDQAEELHNKYDCASADRMMPFPCDCGVPAWVLAECQARRAVIELHEHVGSFLSEWQDGDPVQFEGGEFGCRICALNDREIEPEGWCATLRALAGPFKGHSDFDAGWSQE